LEYSKDYEFKLDVTKKVLLRKKCVYNIEKRVGEYGSKLYFHYCNGKWLMDSHGSLLMFGFIYSWKRKERLVHINITQNFLMLTY
jgi:hypothetical protein